MSRYLISAYSAAMAPPFMSTVIDVNLVYNWWQLWEMGNPTAKANKDSIVTHELVGEKIAQEETILQVHDIQLYIAGT